MLAGIGLAKCAPLSFVVVAALTVAPFLVIPVGLGTAVTLILVNVFPARRARDILMLMGLLFAVSLVVLLRVVQPERLLRVESMPVVTDFFATLQSPVTPLLPSFWAGEVIFAGLHGTVDWLHLAALWTTASAVTIALAAAFARWHFPGYSKAQEARKARFAQWRGLDVAAAWLPLSPVRRQLLVKDVKVFLRDVSQWSQLLLLMALVLVYLYNFRVLDLDRVPGMSGVIKNAYAFLNMGMAGFVMATVTVRFVFPAVSAEGPAFWIIRTAPISLRDFLWSKFWTGLVPVLALTECLVVVGNEFLNTDPFLKQITAGGGRLHGLRPGRSGGRPRRPLPALRRRQPEPGRRLVRWRRLHGRRRALRDGDDRAAQLAVLGLPLRADAAAPAHRRAAVDDGDRLRRRGRREPGALAARDAERREGAAADGPHSRLIASSATASPAG